MYNYTTAIKQILKQNSKSVASVENDIVGINIEAPYIAELRQAAKDRLGTNWVLHSDNQTKRIVKK